MYLFLTLQCKKLDHQGMGHRGFDLETEDWAESRGQALEWSKTRQAVGAVGTVWNSGCWLQGCINSHELRKLTTNSIPGPAHPHIIYSTRDNCEVLGPSGLYNMNIDWSLTVLISSKRQTLNNYLMHALWVRSVGCPESWAEICFILIKSFWSAYYRFSFAKGG